MGVAGASSLQKSGASAQVLFCCLVPWNPRCLAWEGLGIGRTQDRRIKAPPGCAGNRKRVGSSRTWGRQVDLGPFHTARRTHP